mgnify:CR=1 FL=1
MKNYDTVKSLDTKEVEVVNQNFPRGYNIVKEDKSDIYLSSIRFPYIKYWLTKILTISLVLLIFSTTCILTSLIFLLFRPDPKIYTTNDRGEITLLK